MKKILTVVGARPQFIKLAPVSKELCKEFEEVVVHTGQHYDTSMSQVFFDDLNIKKPDYNLEVGSAPNSVQIAKIMPKLDKVVTSEKPDAILIYGDTNSTVASAVVASKHGIKLIHIESGMRSNDSIPEEFNRLMSDHLSQIFFCTSETAVKNLNNEGIVNGVHLVGDVMYDAMLENIKLAEEKSKILDKLGLKPKEYILSTVHRAENTDDPDVFKKILLALIESDEKIILPLHPRARKVLESLNIDEEVKNSNLMIIKPVGYLDMLNLEKNAKKIITDSGGVQKEGYFNSIPCITLRTVSEWKEIVDAGYNKLVGTDKKKIIDAIKNFDVEIKDKNIYGNGDSAKKIVEVLQNEL